MKLETCIKDLWWISRSALSGMETVPTAYDRRKNIKNTIKTHYPQLIQDKSIKSIWQTIIYETTILQPI